jgi:RNA polymerase sigma-54 factor
MGTLSQSLSLRVAQKQVLTQSLAQLVKLLHCNRLELRDLIDQELAANPVLEETAEADEATQEEVQAALEAERVAEPLAESVSDMLRPPDEAEPDSPPEMADAESTVPSESPAASDSFDEIDFGSYFDDYLDPGFKSPAAENPDRPSFDTFLSSRETLAEHLERQLALEVLAEPVRDAAHVIVGNLDDNGYLPVPIEEVAREADCAPEAAAFALKKVQSFDPAGVGARDLRECLLIQLESRGARDGLAWTIASQHLELVQAKRWKDLARTLGRPLAHVEIALNVIRQLDPRPGLKYTTPPAQKVEPDVYIVKDGNDYTIQLNDDDLPQLRLSPSYRRMLDRSAQEAQETRDARSYIRERYNSALQLLKNIEQRRQTILRVCQLVVDRQRDMLDHGVERLRPMMIKDLAEEIGVHPSTVSRAVANKYAHTPQGVFELRWFFSEGVQGPSGSETPLFLLKRRVKKMIEEEDPRKPLTDEQIMARLLEEGIEVTRRTVAKYREDMNIPSTHQRRVRP